MRYSFSFLLLKKTFFIYLLGHNEYRFHPLNLIQNIWLNLDKYLLMRIRFIFFFQRDLLQCAYTNKGIEIDWNSENGFHISFSFPCAVLCLECFLHVFTLGKAYQAYFISLNVGRCLLQQGNQEQSLTRIRRNQKSSRELHWAPVPTSADLSLILSLPSIFTLYKLMVHFDDDD